MYECFNKLKKLGIFLGLALQIQVSIFLTIKGSSSEVTITQMTI